MKPEWYPDWSGQTAAIVGGGASVNQDSVDLFRGRCRVIVINNGYRLAPWADVLYAADGRWWDAHPESKSFAGLKVTPDANQARVWKLHWIDLMPMPRPNERDVISFDAGKLGRGGHGGFQAINLAVQFGARRILLLGFDFRGDHWHGNHAFPLRNPRPETLKKWRKGLDDMAPAFTANGIDVICCSSISELTAYPRMTIEQALC